MKKIILTYILILILLCGCSFNDEYQEKNKYEDFEHYDLRDKMGTNELSTYTYNGAKYYTADITPPRYEMNISGIFYQVSFDDYILLDEIEYRDIRGFQYKDKLYVKYCIYNCFYEFTLNREKTSKKEMNFNYSNISDSLYLREIQDMDDKYFYFAAEARESGENRKYDWGEPLNVRCSVETYNCELY